MGYRRIRDELDGHKGIHVNDKRVLRICRKYDIKSNIKWKPKSCTRGDRNCNRRTPPDGFAEQNGRDAERAD